MSKTTSFNLWLRLRIFLSQDRGILRGSLLEYIVVVLLYLGITTVLTAFVLFNISTHIFSTSGDATAGFLWINYSDQGLNPLVGYTDDANYPYGQDGIGGVSLLSYLLNWLPMRLLSAVVGPVAALNIIMAWGYVSSALAMYWLLKRLTHNKFIAFTGGYAVAFVPYAMLKSSGHLSYIFSGVFTLIIGIFIEFWKKPSTRLSIALGVAVAAAFYTDGYYILLVSILCLSLLLSGLIYSALKKNLFNTIKINTSSTLIAFGVFIVTIAPFLFVQLTQGGEVRDQLASNRSAIAVELQAYRSNIIDFIAPPKDHFLWKQLDGIQQINEAKNQRSNSGENTNYIAYTIYALSIIGAVLVTVRLVHQKKSSLSVLNKNEWDTVLFVSIISLITVPLIISFMFSPEVYVLGITIPLPGVLFVEYDIAYWRVLSRLFVLLNVVIVIFSMLSLWMITKIIDHKYSSRKVSLPIILGILVLIVFEYLLVFDSRPFDFDNNVDQTYHWLKNESSIKSVVELPMVDPLDVMTSDYFTAQIVHNKKLLNLKAPTGQRLTNTLGSINNDELVDFLFERNVDAFVIRRAEGCIDDIPWAQPVFSTQVEVFDRNKQKNITTSSCIYKLRGQLDRDPVFVLYQEGFNPSANALDQTDVAFREGGKGALVFVQSDLSTPYQGLVELSAKLRINGELNPSKPPKWIIRQNGDVVANGVFDKHLVDLRAIVDGSEPATIEIVASGRSLGLADVYLENVDADSLDMQE